MRNFEQAAFENSEAVDQAVIAEFLRRIDKGSISFEDATRELWKEKGKDYVFRNTCFQLTFTDYVIQLLIPANPLRMGVILLPAIPNPGVGAEWSFGNPSPFVDAGGFAHYGVQLGFGSTNFGYGVTGFAFTAGVVGVDDIWVTFPNPGAVPFPFPVAVFGFELTAQPC